MNRILSKFSLVIATTLIATGVWAQTSAKSLSATIPFDFIVNNQLVPAGTYTITSDGSRSEVVKIADRTQNEHLFSFVLPEASDKWQGNSLVFHKYGDRYFLSEIRCQNCSMNSSLPLSKTEKWARIETQGSAMVPISESDVLVALK
jgi:hypothetical protein